MAIPTVFSAVKPQDFTLRPFTVHKKVDVSSTTLIDTSSGYNIVDGVHTSLKTPIGSTKALNDPTNSFDGSYQHIIWQSFNHRYYRNGYNSLETFEHANRRYTYKFLNYSASVMSIPQIEYGESIKPRSVVIHNSESAFKLQDDGNGNLYDPAIDSSSFANYYNLVGYWGFNDEFKRAKYISSTVIKGNLSYSSHVFEPDDVSGVKNITFDIGVQNSGMCAEFGGNSYIITKDRPEFNKANDDQFSISFWIKAPVTQSNQNTSYNSIISKRGVIEEQVFGVSQKYNQSDLMINTRHISSSITDKLTDIYPYDFELVNSTGGSDSGKLRFRASNGISVVEMTSSVSICDGQYHHIVVTDDSNNINLYIDGSNIDTKSSIRDIHNKHSVLFGALNRDGNQGFSGSLDEIRFYDYSIGTSTIQTLTDSSSMAMYQTSVVGNVFYRQGNIVVSPLYPTYLNAFQNTWSASYRGTHTAFQYEALCRVKKGSFNLTYNPTARKSFKSDLYINDMTGSLLKPYATTIGLYNSEGDLVAVGKLGQAVQMRDDVDINFLVRWDG